MSRVAARPVVKWVCLAAYAALVGWWVHAYGVPTQREEVIGWLVGALVVVAAFTPGRRVWRVIADWLPFTLVFVAYDYSRGAATAIGMPVHVTPQIALDRWIGFGTVPTVWLQQHFLSQNRVHAWQVIPSAAYLTHFIVPYVVAAWLWARDHDRWWQYTERFVGLSFLGVATYILVPWSPPWMASDKGLLPPLSRCVQFGWSYVHLDFAQQLFDKGKGTFNLNAALPSLHASYPMLIALFFWKTSRWWTRIILVIYPLVMAFSLVFGAEHYVGDILLGWIYTVAVHLLFGRFDRWRAGRAALRPPPGAPAVAG